MAFLLSRKTITGSIEEILLPFSPVELRVLSNLIKDPSTWESQDPATKEYFEKVHLVKNGQITIPLLREYLIQHQDWL